MTQNLLKIFSPLFIAALLTVSCATKDPEPKAWTVEVRQDRGAILYADDLGSLRKARSLIPCATPEVVDDLPADQEDLSYYCREVLLKREPRVEAHQLIVDPALSFCRQEQPRRRLRQLKYKCLE